MVLVFSVADEGDSEEKDPRKRTLSEPRRAVRLNRFVVWFWPLSRTLSMLKSC